MRYTVTFPRIIRFDKFTEVVRFASAPVYIHWSVLVISAVILAGAVKFPLLNLVGLVSWLGVILLHESGHMFVAHKRGCDVETIYLYPILGLTRYSRPWSEFDHCLIAWGGVLAQAIVFVPVIISIAVFGYTRLQVLNAALAIWGPFSLGVAVFNLFPIPGLDGWTAWRIVPLAITRVLVRKKKQFNVMRGGR